jgi:outer membrane receptor protein involved in Fe transport
MARLSASYWGMRYAEPSFIRRSERITSHAPSKEEYNTLMVQQRLKDAVLVDAVVAKTFKLKDDMSIRLQLSVNNLLGSKVVYRSYEQHRVRRINTTSHTHLMPFGNMTQYGYGRTFKFMVSLWF